MLKRAKTVLAFLPLKTREKDEANLQRQFLDSSTTRLSASTVSAANSFESSSENESHTADKQLKDLEAQLRENARKRRDIDSQLKGDGRKEVLRATLMMLANYHQFLLSYWKLWKVICRTY